MENNADSSTQIVSPVLRVGRLVASSDAISKEPKNFTFREGRDALIKLADCHQDFDSAFKSEITRYFRSIKQKISFNVPGSIKRNRPAKRSKSIGAIYDFTEQYFLINHKYYISSRPCITVCINEPNFIFNIKGKPVYSKIWTRFSLVGVKGADANNFSQLDIADSHLLMSQLKSAARSAEEALLKVYQKFVSKLAGSEIECTLMQGFAVYAVSDDSPAFREAFNELRSGVALSDCRKSNKSLDLLRRLCDAHLEISLCEPALNKNAPVLPQDDDSDLVIFEDGSAFRGLFVVRYGAEEARFVGIAKAPFAVKELPNITASEMAEVPQTAPHLNPSSHIVSAALINAYAARF